MVVCFFEGLIQKSIAGMNILRGYCAAEFACRNKKKTCEIFTHNLSVFPIMFCLLFSLNRNFFPFQRM